MERVTQQDVQDLLDRALPELQTYRELMGRASGHGSRKEQAAIARVLGRLDLLLVDIERIRSASAQQTGRPPGPGKPWGRARKAALDGIETSET